MLYYRFNISIDDAISGIEENGFASAINSETAALNSKYSASSKFYVCKMGKQGTLTVCGVLDHENADNPESLAKGFVEALGFGVVSCDHKEIGISEFASLIITAENGSFVDDADEILLKNAIGSRRICQSTFFHENLSSSDMTLEKASEIADGMHYSGLMDEINRIYGEPTRPFLGHPVHYLLMVDNEKDACCISELLTACLYSKGRLKSRRSSFMSASEKSFMAGPRFVVNRVRPQLDETLLEKVYKAQSGGTVILAPGKISAETETIDESSVTVESLSRKVTAHRHDVLSILIFPKALSDVADRLRNSLKNIRFIEIYEKTMDYVSSKEYLAGKALAKGADDCSSLVSLLSDKNCNYCVSELDSIYEKWMDQRLVTEVFSCYQDCQESKAEVPKTVGSAYEKLQSLVGLGPAKDVIQKAIDYSRFQKMYGDSLPSGMNVSRHMVFTGNPGTAKTTVARLYAQILKDNNVLPVGKLIEVGRNDLVGKYVGWTARLVKEAFDAAKGSVLFIDEAYSLCDYREGMFGDEAINTIVQLMENQRNDTIVIFAGYPEKMEFFLRNNPGLRSRIAFHVNFEDYSEDELYGIFSSFVSESGMRCLPGVEPRVRSLIESNMGCSDFGNGRFARNLFEQARMSHASRIVSMSPDSVCPDDLVTLSENDFPAPVQKDEEPSKKPYREIGFNC